MKKDIDLAHQADCLDEQHYGSVWAEKLRRFAILIRADEREACATFLETGVDLGGLANHPGWQRYTADLLIGCAEALRARSNT